MALDIDFTAPRVTKGRLTDYRSGTFKEFSINPSSIKEGRSIEIEKMLPPGMSHSVLQPGGGQSKPISFTLFLDADIGYRARRRAQPVPMDISEEIAWYESHTFPEGGARLGDPDSSFPLLLFTFGKRYQGVMVLMAECTIEITKLTPELTPMSAKLDITLERYVRESQNRSSIYNPGSSRIF